MVDTFVEGKKYRHKDSSKIVTCMASGNGFAVLNHDNPIMGGFHYSESKPQDYVEHKELLKGSVWVIVFRRPNGEVSSLTFRTHSEAREWIGWAINKGYKALALQEIGWTEGFGL